MEHDVPQQPSGPPRDTLQRVLRFLLNGLGFTLLFLAPITAVATIVLPIVLPFTLNTVNTVYYLFHVFLALTALVFLRRAIIGVVLVRAPRRLSPKLLSVVARRTSRPRRLGQLYIWSGVWFVAYFAAGIVFFPWPPLPSTPPLSLFALGAALPIVLIVARGPLIWHRVSERRRRASSS